MELKTLRICNFQSFGPEPVALSFDEITYLIGPNGSGKTAVLQAICRLFAFEPSLRRIQRSDFHVPLEEKEQPEERALWIEADFLFPELAGDEDNSTVAPHFGHMRLDDVDGIPRVRYRLNATMGIGGDIDEALEYVLDVDADGTIVSTSKVPRQERNHIQVHYLPARRDPAEHINFGANALLGRILRAVDWENEREHIQSLTGQISESLEKNPSINALSEQLQRSWDRLHKGEFFSAPHINFANSEIESLLRYLTISFSPGHEDYIVDFGRLSDGQKSMLYLSLVLSSHAIGRAVLSGDDDSFDPNKLTPPVFTMVAIEEPENSLSPHYLGRIVNALTAMTGEPDAQALIATHAPTILRRVDPIQIRYLRLNEDRVTSVREIPLPSEGHAAYKFVREAVQAFPEIYFSRLVVLGEGDSEEIVIPRLMQAKGVPVDESAVTVAPLGGRHVNHFWRLLEGLDIPYLTLLDLDLGRFGGGWGRIRYAAKQLLEHTNNPPELTQDHIDGLPAWNVPGLLPEVENWIGYLQSRGVFFSSPLDLDFAMLNSFPNEYNLDEDDKTPPDGSKVKAVLGDRGDQGEYSEEELKLFITYHKRFKLGSKPASHIEALANLNDDELAEKMPVSLKKLVESAIDRLESLPE